MRLNLKLDRIKKHTYELIIFIAVVILLIMIFSLVGKAQGLVNNGAVITINNGVNVTIDGGSTIGNFTNQDFGASTGTVENTGQLNVSGDWINNSSQHVFNSNTGSVILFGNGQAITGITSTYFNDLFLNGGGIKTLGVDALVGGGFVSPSGTLSLGSSQLDLNSHTLTVNNPSSTGVTRTNGFIISETNTAFNPSIVQWNCGANTGNYIFPFGSSNGYTPVGIAKNTSVASDLSVSTRATKFSDNLPWGSGVTHLNSPTIGGPGEVPVVIDRWYYVSASSPINVDLAFTYSGIENTTTFAPTGTFAMQNWTGLWQPPVGSGPGVLAGTAIITATSQTIGPVNNNWVLANILAPLPIQLIAYNAKCDGNKKVSVTWQTASEQNLNNYNVQRSADGIHFQTLTTVPPQMNITGIKNYNWTDHNPLSALAYYRLKENDVNGDETIFKVLAVKSCDGINDDGDIYSSGTTIYFNINHAVFNDCLIQVFDVAGKKVMNKVHQFHDGNRNFQIETELAPGIYFTRCEVGNYVMTKKVLLSQ
ncbi:MAG: T9SS type A sorting domain-containing protein [Bacteroidia bacterium]